MTGAAAVYLEGPARFEHAGRTFTADGAVVTESHCVAYLASQGVLTDWQGTPIGTWRAVSSWSTPRSFMSSRMYQVHATVQGRTYTGRSAGASLLFRGRRIAAELKGGRRDEA